MELTGKVVDQANGKPLGAVTIWEIYPDGQNAEVLGYSDPSGNFDVQLNDPDSNVNFVLDGYTGTNIAAAQVALSDQVLLAKDNGITAKFTLSGVPSWLWLFMAAIGIYYIGTGKPRKRKT